MSQTWRFPLILGLSVLFGAPVLGELALSPDDLVSAGLRYLGALGLSWLGVSFIFRLMEGYAIDNHLAEEAIVAEEARAAMLLRAQQDLQAAAAEASAQESQHAAEPAMS